MHDDELIASFTNADALRPTRIRPDESELMRAAALITAPLWLMAITAAALSRLVRGHLPLFVLHERVGFLRDTLWIPKVATASVAGNKRRLGGVVQLATGPPVELDVDGRIEHWMRVSGADELPQLLLVLRGKMRLVGPRPVTPDELAEMSSNEREVGVDYLQPGIVGLWQLLDRHRYELDERRDLDMLMLDNWSGPLRGRILAAAVRQAIGRVIGR